MITYVGGGTYVGEIKGLVGLIEGPTRHGQGTMIHEMGQRYIGEFKNDREWEGTEHDPDGTVIAVYSKGVRKEKYQKYLQC